MGYDIGAEVPDMRFKLVGRSEVPSISQYLLSMFLCRFIFFSFRSQLYLMHASSQNSKGSNRRSWHFGAYACRGSGLTVLNPKT